MERCVLYQLKNETYLLSKRKPIIEVSSFDFNDVRRKIQELQKSRGVWILSIWANGNKVQTITKLSPLPEVPKLDQSAQLYSSLNT